MRILLVGVGNLGQRYLEGLNKLKKKKYFFMIAIDIYLKILKNYTNRKVKIFLLLTN